VVQECLDSLVHLFRLSVRLWMPGRQGGRLNPQKTLNLSPKF
jgi:hypothetical protein